MGGSRQSEAVVGANACRSQATARPRVPAVRGSVHVPEFVHVGEIENDFEDRRSAVGAHSGTYGMVTIDQICDGVADW
jgi:hypothetical protein